MVNAHVCKAADIPAGEVCIECDSPAVYAHLTVTLVKVPLCRECLGKFIAEAFVVANSQ